MKSHRTPVFLCCKSAISGLVDPASASYIIPRAVTFSVFGLLDGKSHVTPPLVFLLRENTLYDTSFIFCTIDNKFDGAYIHFNLTLRRLVTKVLKLIADSLIRVLKIDSPSGVHCGLC